MTIQTQSSPMLRAIDLMRVNIEDLNTEELNAHAVEVLDTIAALNDYINGPLHKSHNALLNAHQLTRKLSLHMARLRDLLQARQSAHAIAEASRTANAPSLSPDMSAFGWRSRVIRPLNSADNATSGHIQILSNATQWSGTKAVCGGEAKEGEPSESLAKPDGERSEGGGRRW